jgi:hypothetical protein
MQKALAGETDSSMCAPQGKKEKSDNKNFWRKVEN